jgi:hypothetical protein
METVACQGERRMGEESGGESTGGSSAGRAELHTMTVWFSLTRRRPASRRGTHYFLRVRPFEAASRRETPGANFGTRLAGILISEPV